MFSRSLRMFAQVWCTLIGAGGAAYAERIDPPTVAVAAVEPAAPAVASWLMIAETLVTSEPAPAEQPAIIPALPVPRQQSATFMLSARIASANSLNPPKSRRGASFRSDARQQRRRPSCVVLKPRPAPHPRLVWSAPRADATGTTTAMVRDELATAA